MLKELQKFLREIEAEGAPQDLHITRMFSSLIAVSNGKVIKLTDPQLKFCPLVNSLYGFSGQLDLPSLKHKIIEAVEWKISEFGLFTDFRQIHRKSIAIPFGASEMIMYDLKKKRADAAVVVCDGAGTVITRNPYLVQGIGARMNGVFYTTPLKRVIQKITELDGDMPITSPGRIDQVSGVRLALQKYSNIDVTVSGFGDDSLQQIRELEQEYDASVTILAVCTTGIGDQRIKEIQQHADLVWSCASGKVRDHIGKSAKLQIATKIPVYALTKTSLEFVSSYSDTRLQKYFETYKEPYLISGRCKHDPTISDCMKIRMGTFDSFIGRVSHLPLRVEGEPTPLL